MPPNPSPELIGLLIEAGPVLHGGMGLCPLTAAELIAWQKGTAAQLTPWEFRQLLTLSSEYLAELRRASDPQRPPPWVDTPTPERRVSVAKHVRSILRD